MARERKISEKIPASTQRLLEFVEASGLTQSEFARRVGITPAGLGNLFSRGTEVSGPLARAVELEFGVSHVWLTDGLGERLRPQGPTHLQKLLLRLVPNYDPALTWRCFEGLLRNSFMREARGVCWPAQVFAEYAEFLLEQKADSSWLTMWNERQGELDAMLPQLKELFLRLSYQTPIGSREHTLLLSVLLDAVELPENLEIQTLLKASEQEQYEGDLRRFAELRRGLVQRLEPPWELKRDYVAAINTKADAEEEESLRLREQGRLLVDQGQRWLRLDESGDVQEDRLRRKIYQKKLEVTAWSVEKWQHGTEVLEASNAKLSELQNELNLLKQQWKEGACGITD